MSYFDTFATILDIYGTKIRQISRGIRWEGSRGPKRPKTDQKSKIWFQTFPLEGGALTRAAQSASQSEGGAGAPVRWSGTPRTGMLESSMGIRGVPDPPTPRNNSSKPGPPNRGRGGEGWGWASLPRISSGSGPPNLASYVPIHSDVPGLAGTVPRPPWVTGRACWLTLALSRVPHPRVR